MNKLATLNTRELSGIFGGMCFGYTDANYCRTENGSLKDNCIGLEGNKKLRTCKERVCSNPKNKSWKYSVIFTRGNAREPAAQGLCHSDQIIYTNETPFIRFGRDH